MLRTPLFYMLLLLGAVFVLFDYDYRQSCKTAEEIRNEIMHADMWWRIYCQERNKRTATLVEMDSLGYFYMEVLNPDWEFTIHGCDSISAVSRCTMHFGEGRRITLHRTRNGYIFSGWLSDGVQP